MKLNQFTDPINVPMVEKYLPMVDVTLSVDQFKKHPKKSTRDALNGEVMAGMYLLGATPGPKNNLINYMRDGLLQNGLRDDQIDQLEFAEVYDVLREVELEKNNGKSANTEFWRLAWGVYTSYMWHHATSKPETDNNFNQLFG